MSEDRSKMIELLRAHHSFPGPYSFKFIGKAGDDFAAQVVAAARAVLGTSEDPAHVTRLSDRGAHVSITLTPVVQSPEQVIAVYDAVAKVSGVLVSM